MNIKKMLISRGYWNEAGELGGYGGTAGGGSVDSGGGDWTPPEGFGKRDTELVERGLAAMDEAFGDSGEESEVVETVDKGKEQPTSEEKPDPAAQEALQDPRTEEERARDESGIHPPVGDVNVMPKSWKAGLAQDYAALPEHIKQEIHRREENFFKGYENAKPAIQFAQEMAQSMAPFQEVMQQVSASPGQAINYLMQTYASITRGTPEQKAAAFRGLFKETGLTPDQLFQQAGEPAYEDPAVARLREELTGVKSTLEARQKADERALRQRAEAEFDSFIAKNPDAAQALDDMLPFLRSGQSLQDAYEKARWANPQLRAAALAKESADRQAKADKEAAEKLERAKKASRTNVRESSRSGGPTAPVGSIDDTMKEVYRNLQNR